MHRSKNKIQIFQLLCTFYCVLFTLSSFSQVLVPVKWTYSQKKLADNEYQLTFKAFIDKGWHLYAQTQPVEETPILPTKFIFESNADIKFIGQPTEPKPHVAFEPNFDTKLAWFENEATFTQKVKISKTTLVKGEIEHMSCNDQTCIKPDYNPTFEFKLEFATSAQATGEDTAKAPILSSDTSASIDSAKQISSTLDTVLNKAQKFPYKHPTIDLKKPLGKCDIQSDDNVEGKSFWAIFILGFIGGLLALLTPCVFPMIPLTVSFFTKSSEGKKGMLNAFLYGFFIFMVYIVLSLPFHVLDSLDPNILNTISTNAYLNVFFFIVFVLFAISFFGYYEITLPNSLANKADSASNSGGLLGIFFMALTLALVSFSCTGPILGSLLAGSLTSNGGAMQLTAGMGGFGLALALPFALFAAFPSWLNSLPKSGGWLTKVKILLGFIELALAVKFLSNADLVEHWGILKYEVFMGFWILIGLALALYILGFIKLPHDTPFQKWTFFRLTTLLLAISFVIYLVSGFKYNKDAKTFSSLSLLSGLAPPAGYSWMYPVHCPLNLNCFHDYEQGVKYAKQVNKPILLDFTGWACVNCRKMEENVWNKPEVFKIINEEYVLISLYVDDREVLPDSLQDVYVNAQGRSKKIKTTGDKWSTFETETFNSNAQPFYFLLNNKEQLLVPPVGYTPAVAEYVNYLKCGLTVNAQNN